MNIFNEKILIPVMIILGLLSPVLVTAQVELDTPNRTSGQESHLQTQCVAFSTLKDQLQIRFSMMEDALTQRISKVEERTQQRDIADKDQFSTEREMAKEDRNLQFEKMRENARTELEVGGSTDFRMLYAGQQNQVGKSEYLGTVVNFWTSSALTGNNAWSYSLQANKDQVWKITLGKSYRISIRCIKN